VVVTLMNDLSYIVDIMPITLDLLYFYFLVHTTKCQTYTLICAVWMIISHI